MDKERNSHERPQSQETANDAQCREPVTEHHHEHEKRDAHREKMNAPGYARRAGAA